MPTVLVIDGEREQFARLRDYLAQDGYQALWAPGPGEALRLAHSTPPDLLILDSSGAPEKASDAIMLTKQDSLTAHVPVILLCRNTSDSLADGLDTDADLVLEKPVDPVELLIALRSLLRPKAPAPSAS